MSSSSPATPLAEATDADWLQLRRAAPGHELPALLRALTRWGVGLEDIRFDSRDPEEVMDAHSGSRIRLGPSGTLVRGFWVEEGDRPQVTIFLNIGLFSASSPLPNYFHSLLAERELGESLAVLLRALDDGLLRARARAEYRADLRHSQWEEHLREALVSRSPWFIDGLFRRIFPELRIRVAWRQVPRRLGIDRLALGSATLGSCSFDGQGLINSQGVEVTLIAPYDLGEQECMGDWGQGQGQTWVQEAKRRLGRYVLPQFGRHPVALLVRLQILERHGASRIEAARIGEDALSEASRPFSVVLHEGMAQSRSGAT